VNASTVYAGGDFITIGGQPRYSLAALDAATGTASAWNPNADDEVDALLVAGTIVYASGFFTTIHGESRPYLAALDPVSGAPRDWAPGIYLDPNYEENGILALTLVGTTLYPGGLFATTDGTGNSNLVAYTDVPTPTEMSLVSANATPGVVDLVWYSASTARIATVERRGDDGDWIALSRISPDGTGRWVYVDDNVLPGHRYDYRLGVLEGGVEQFYGETRVDVPSAYTFALEGVRPNPVSANGSVWFVLPNNEPAQLDVIDVSGRRLESREIGSLGAGAHAVPLFESRTHMRAGVYFIRLTQAGQMRTRRIAVRN
jgi:hypothetical protein